MCRFEYLDSGPLCLFFCSIFHPYFSKPVKAYAILILYLRFIALRFSCHRMSYPIYSILFSRCTFIWLVQCTPCGTTFFFLWKHPCESLVAFSYWIVQKAIVRHCSPDECTLSSGSPLSYYHVNKLPFSVIFPYILCPIQMIKYC